MKAAFQFLFLATYLVSSLATTQHRVGSIVDLILNSGSRTAERSFDEPCQVKPNYTHFSQAKKIIPDFGAELSEIPLIRPLVSASRLVPSALSPVVDIATRQSSPRAPPVL